MKKSLFKPAAFFKGILIPLCEVNKTFSFIFLYFYFYFSKITQKYLIFFLWFWHYPYMTTFSLHDYWLNWSPQVVSFSYNKVHYLYCTKKKGIRAFGGLDWSLGWNLSSLLAVHIMNSLFIFIFIYLYITKFIIYII